MEDSNNKKMLDYFDGKSFTGKRDKDTAVIKQMHEALEKGYGVITTHAKKNGIDTQWSGSSTPMWVLADVTWAMGNPRKSEEHFMYVYLKLRVPSWGPGEEYPSCTIKLRYDTREGKQGFFGFSTEGANKDKNVVAFIRRVYKDVIGGKLKTLTEVAGRIKDSFQHERVLLIKKEEEDKLRQTSLEMKE